MFKLLDGYAMLSATQKGLNRMGRPKNLLCLLNESTTGSGKAKQVEVHRLQQGVRSTEYSPTDNSFEIFLDLVADIQLG